MLEQHYYSIHHVVLQPSCCAPPSVFQTIMGKELQLRQQNFSVERGFLATGSEELGASPQKQRQAWPHSTTLKRRPLVCREIVDLGFHHSNQSLALVGGVGFR